MPKGGVLGAPQAKGIVIEILEVNAIAPHYGSRKCVKVKLIRSSKVVKAIVPFDGGIQFLSLDVCF